MICCLALSTLCQKKKVRFILPHTSPNIRKKQRPWPNKNNDLTFQLYSRREVIETSRAHQRLWSFTLCSFRKGARKKSNIKTRHDTNCFFTIELNPWVFSRGVTLRSFLKSIWLRDFFLNIWSWGFIIADYATRSNLLISQECLLEFILVTKRLHNFYLL